MEEEEDFIIASKGNNPHMNKSTEQIKHKESDFAEMNKSIPDAIKERKKKVGQLVREKERIIKGENLDGGIVDDQSLGTKIKSTEQLVKEQHIFREMHNKSVPVIEHPHTKKGNKLIKGNVLEEAKEVVITKHQSGDHPIKPQDSRNKSESYIGNLSDILPAKYKEQDHASESQDEGKEEVVVLHNIDYKLLREISSKELEKQDEKHVNPVLDKRGEDKSPKEMGKDWESSEDREAESQEGEAPEALVLEMSEIVLDPQSEHEEDKAETILDLQANWEDNKSEDASPHQAKKIDEKHYMRVEEGKENRYVLQDGDEEASEDEGELKNKLSEEDSWKEREIIKEDQRLNTEPQSKSEIAPIIQKSEVIVEGEVREQPVEEHSAVLQQTPRRLLETKRIEAITEGGGRSRKEDLEKEEVIRQLIGIKGGKLREILMNESGEDIHSIQGGLEGLNQHPNGGEEDEIEYWDYVICIDNPDFDSALATKFKKTQPKEIAQKEAVRLYDTCFKAEQFTFPFQSAAFTNLEKNTFLECFNTLPQKEGAVQQTNKKMLNKGGRFTKLATQLGDKTVWQDNGSQTRDFRTLLMNLMVLKLEYILGLKTKLMLSTDGDTIYIVIRGEEEIIHYYGEKLNSNAQFHIGRTDLGSLEPCNSLLLRYRSIQKAQDLVIKEEQLKEIFDIIDEQKSDGLKITNMYSSEDENVVVWDFYSIYLDYLRQGLPLFEKTDPQEKEILIAKLIKFSIMKANENILEQPSQKKLAQHKLKNLWTRLGIRSGLGAYVDYKQDFDQNIYKHHAIREKGERETFLEIDKLKIMDCMIQSQLIIPNMLKEKMITAYYPLHNEFSLYGSQPANTPPNILHKQLSARDSMVQQARLDIIGSEHRTQQGLVNKCKFNWKQMAYIPGKAMRKYFGEKLGMYFEWISNYAQYCLGFSLVGVIFFFILLAFQKTAEVGGKPELGFVITGCIFTILLVIWSSIFQEHWKRKQIILATEWGQLDFEDDEHIRAEFKGVIRCSPVTDQFNEIYYPPWKRIIKMIISVSFSIFLICLSIFFVYLFSRLKDYYLEKYYKTKTEKWIPTIFSTANAIQIVIFNIIHGIMVVKFTNFENHRTQTDHESSLITKSFFFEFFNSYYSLFFIAFLKDSCIGENKHGDMELDQDYSCIFELDIQLRSIFCVAIIKNLIEIGVPYIKTRINLKLNQEGMMSDGVSSTDRLRSKIGRECALEDYSVGGLDGTYGEYLEMIIQYGYIVLFGFAFPLSVTLAALNNLIELYVDKYKLIALVRRPVPIGAANIGIWQRILNSISFIGVVSNVGLITITLNYFFDNISHKYIAFIGFCLVIILLKITIDVVIPDIPTAFKIIAKRHEIVKEKVFLNISAKTKHIQDIIEDERAKIVPKKKVY